MSASGLFSTLQLPRRRRKKKHPHELNVCVLTAVASTLGVYSFLYTMRLTSSSTALSASNFQLWGSRGALKKKPSEWLPQCQLKAVSSGLGGLLVSRQLDIGEATFASHSVNTFSCFKVKKVEDC